MTVVIGPIHSWSLTDFQALKTHQAGKVQMIPRKTAWLKMSWPTFSSLNSKERGSPAGEGAFGRFVNACLWFWKHRRVCVSMDFNDLLLPPPGHYGPVSTHRIINITLKCLQEPFTSFHLFMFLTLFFKEKQQISNHSPQGYLYAQTDINWVINFVNELCFRAIKEDHFDDSWARWAGLMVACLNPQNRSEVAGSLADCQLFYEQCVLRMLAEAFIYLFIALFATTAAGPAAVLQVLFLSPQRKRRRVRIREGQRSRRVPPRNLKTRLCCHATLVRRVC